MDIPQKLRELVDITDHGVVDQLDPETGETYRAYVTTYTARHDGLEYGISLASTPILGDLPDAYEKVLEMGTYAVLSRAGLI